MYGDKANKLILEAKRTQALEKLPAFRDDLVKAIVRETKDIAREVNDLSLPSQGQEEEEEDRIKQCQLFVSQLCMRRNKRCLLAYQKLRAEKMVEKSWCNAEVGEEDYMQNLSHFEQDFYHQYDDVTIEYKSQFSDIDLNGSMEPPTDVFIEVRVLKDAGEIQTEYGVFNLSKDSQFFVRQADVERLIQQGYLLKLA